MEMLQWLFGAHHVPERSEVDIVFGGLYQAFYTFGLVWLFYLALEPYARRLWPRTLTSWVRIFRGRFRDPLVGRDLLIGCALGAAWPLSLYLYMLLPGWLGNVPPRPDLPPHPGELTALTGLSDAVSQTFATVTNTTVTCLYIILGLLVLRLILRKMWLAVGAAFVLQTAIWAPGYPYWGFIPMGLYAGAWLYVFLRFGWLPAIVGAFVIELLQTYPLTVDVAAWYAYATYLVALVVLATAIYGFQVSLAGRPAFGELMAEE